jgi:NitT/TauT family transport system substrate-binding protein
MVDIAFGCSGRIKVTGWMRWVSLVAAAAVLASCGEAVSSSTADDAPITLRLGYLPNLTQSPALVGVKKGFFADALGNKVTLDTHTFNAGPEAVTGLLSGSIDAAFIGPNPAINAFAQSHGRAVRIVAGATSGGALLVVKPGIHSVAELKGKKIADPQLGGTQDIALRWFLRENGLKSDTAGGGDLSVVPQDNSTALTAFKQGQIDGAWVPEPWASRLIVEGGATALVDERDLWPRGLFVTTNLVVTTSFLGGHPARVSALLEGLHASIAYLSSNRTDAQKVSNDAYGEITGKKLSAGVVALAWPHMTFTLDPIASTLKGSADHAHRLGLVAELDLQGLYDLTLVNKVLVAHNEPVVVGL